MYTMKFYIEIQASSWDYKWHFVICIALSGLRCCSLSFSCTVNKKRERNGCVWYLCSSGGDWEGEAVLQWVVRAGSLWRAKVSLSLCSC